MLPVLTCPRIGPWRRGRVSVEASPPAPSGSRAYHGRSAGLVVGRLCAPEGVKGAPRVRLLVGAPAADGRAPFGKREGQAVCAPVGLTCCSEADPPPGSGPIPGAWGHPGVGPAPAAPASRCSAATTAAGLQCVLLLMLAWCCSTRSAGWVFGSALPLPRTLSWDLRMISWLIRLESAAE